MARRPRRCDGNWPKSPVSSHKTEKLLYLARSFVWFVIHRQALTEGTVLHFLEETGPQFQHEHPSQAKAWSTTRQQAKRITSFLSYYKITQSIGLASGTEHVTYRFNPACRLCRIKKRFCICSMSLCSGQRLETFWAVLHHVVPLCLLLTVIGDHSWGTFVSLRNRRADIRGRQNAHDRAVTCLLCRDPHKTLMFSGLCKNIYLKESEVWRKVISNKIIVTLVTQGLPSSFLSRTVA